MNAHGPNRLDRIAAAAAVLIGWAGFLAVALHFTGRPPEPRPAFQVAPHPRCFPEGVIPDGRYVQHFMRPDFRSADT